MIIKEKCGTVDREEEKIDFYHYFDIELTNNQIIVKVTEDSEQYLKNNPDIEATWHIPVQKVPEIIKNITDSFYNFNPYKDKYIATDLGDSFFFFNMEINERNNRFEKIWICQSNDCKEYFNKNLKFINEPFTMDWNDKYETPMEVSGKRTMPKSLAAFLEGLKKTYNTWQKDHPDFEKIK